MRAAAGGAPPGRNLVRVRGGVQGPRRHHEHRVCTCFYRLLLFNFVDSNFTGSPEFRLTESLVRSFLCFQGYSRDIHIAAGHDCVLHTAGAVMEEAGC